VSFLAAPALGALALVAVPIALHLWQRRRFRVVEWAPMQHLVLALASARRHLRLEQRLLLLLRCLVVVVLALALARPSLRSDALLAGLAGLAGGGRASHLVVLDDTLSMGYAVGGEDAFTRACGVVARLARGAGRGDSLTLLVASDPAVPVLNDVELDGLDLASVLAGLERGDAGARWESVLGEAERRLARARHPARDLALVTDLRRAGWGAGVRAPCDALAAAGIALRVIDVGCPERADLALVDLALEPGVVVAGIPVALEATVRNEGPAPVGPCAARLEVGGDEGTRELPRIEPGATVRLPLAVTFASPGLESVRFALPGDALAADDARALVVDVRESAELLLVDGDPSAEPFESETDFLTAAFTVGDSAWRVRVQTDAEWLAAPPPRVDLLVLANVAAVPREHAERLEAQVADGMGLFLFPGDRVDPEAFEHSLHRGGAGLAPAGLGPVDGSGARGLALEPCADSPLGALAALAPEALGEVATRALQGVVPAGSSAGGTRVLARWDDAARRPAVLEKRFGRGRTLLWSVGADRAWSDWPIEPTFLLAVREAARACADRGADGLVATAGAPLVLDTRGAPARDPVLATEDGEALGRLVLVGDAGAPIVTFEGVRRAGVHRLGWTGTERVERKVAVQPDPAESDLARVGDAELAAWAGASAPRVVPAAELETALAGGREVWRALLVGALGLVVLEALLAAWVGRRG